MLAGQYDEVAVNKKIRDLVTDNTVSSGPLLRLLATNWTAPNFHKNCLLLVH